MELASEDPVLREGDRPGAMPLHCAWHAKTLARAVAVLVWLTATLLFAWVLYGPQFRDDEGLLEVGTCLVITLVVALLMWGWAVLWRSVRFGSWLVLSLVGQAVTLQLIDAGPYMRYQHYRPLGSLLTETNPVLLIYLGLQAALVIVHLRTRWSVITTWLDRFRARWQLAGVGLVLFLTGATVSHEIPVYLAELCFAGLVQAVNLGAVVLMAWSLPEDTLMFLERAFDRVFGRPGDGGTAGRGGLDRFAVLAAVWVLVLSTVLSVVVYERHPHIPDEVAYLYQARFLANGVLTMPAPPVQDAFDIYLMQFQGDKWYPSPPPGWPAILALGVLLGVPWLVNPFLAGVNTLLVYVVLCDLYSRRTARMATVLLCVSPWYVFMAMNLMTHTATLTCALVAALGVIWSRKTGRAAWAWLAGSALGLMSLIRMLEGLVMASLLGLWAIGAGGRRLRFTAIAALILGTVVVGGAVLPYNRSLTGDPAVFPIMAYTDQLFGPNSNAYGFGPQRGMGWPIDPFPGHGPLDALVNSSLNTFSVNIELFGWSTGSLFLIAVLVFSGSYQRSDYLMMAVIAAVFGVYFFYYFSGGPDFGARYWFLMIVPCAALTVRGMQVMSGRLASRPTGCTWSDTRVVVVVLSLCLFAVVNYFPWRAIDKYHHYLGMRPDIRDLAGQYSFGRSLVLIRGDGHPDYASAAAYNPLDLRADAPVYVWDRDPQVRAEVLAAYPDRQVWIVAGPSVTLSGFKVVGGPLTAEEIVGRD